MGFEVRQSELIDAEELARRLGAQGEAEVARMSRWLKRQCRPSARDRLPCLRFGRAARFDWASRELKVWIERRRK